MIIVGGTYDEICFEPRWEEKYGSGLRACRVINSIDPKLHIDFHTFGNDNTKLFLSQLNKIFSSIGSNVTQIEKTVTFYYDYPLITPRIYPRLDTIEKSKNLIDVEGGDILFFGMIEGNAQIKAKRVVYDPQSPTNPIPFSKTQSSTEKLAIVVNYGEATKLAKCCDIENIKKYFLQEEKADVLVLKMGPMGAIVIDVSEGKEERITVYKTRQVWPIGSGDTFAAAFAYYWFANESAIEAAKKASKLTAIFCNTKNFDFQSSITLEELNIVKTPHSKIYLAGPFFTFAERWLIDQIRSCLINMGLSVFSPWHDVGHGIASEVVSKDLEGLEHAKLVFAIIDGLDSGTLFEVGYAIKKKIPVIAYVENETDESIKMLEGTGCIIEKDLTTAIYKTYWLLAENV